MLTADEDYSARFNDDGTVSIALVNGGKGDGATALTISGSILDPTKITAADIVGGVNAATGAETGLEVVRQVFPSWAWFPAFCWHPASPRIPWCAQRSRQSAARSMAFSMQCALLTSTVPLPVHASTPTWQTRRSSRAQLLVKHMACGCTARSAAPSTAVALCRCCGSLQRQPVQRHAQCQPVQCQRTHFLRLPGRWHRSPDGSGAGQCSE